MYTQNAEHGVLYRYLCKTGIVLIPQAMKPHMPTMPVKTRGTRKNGIVTTEPHLPTRTLPPYASNQHAVACVCCPGRVPPGCVAVAVCRVQPPKGPFRAPWAVAQWAVAQSI